MSIPLRCAISPDADDLFMFRALMLGLVDPGPFRFEISTADTDALNRVAKGESPERLPDVSAISIAWYPRLHPGWQLLPHGGSVGRGYGPVVVAPEPLSPADLAHRRIGVPGTSTTAFTVLRLFCDFEPVVIPITPPERVFEALREGRVEAALLIHEGRLTFRDHGLYEILDIGRWWREDTGLPLPLGGNVIRRDLGPDRIRQASAILRQSIAHGLEHREDAISWLLERGGPLKTREQVDHYLRLYANEDTLDYGEDGRRGIETLLRRGAHAGILPPCPPVDLAP